MVILEVQELKAIFIIQETVVILAIIKPMRLMLLCIVLTSLRIPMAQMRWFTL